LPGDKDVQIFAKRKVHWSLTEKAILFKVNIQAILLALQSIAQFLVLSDTQN